MFIVVGSGSNPYVVAGIIAVQLLPALLGNSSFGAETFILVALVVYVGYTLYANRSILRTQGLQGFLSSVFSPGDGEATGSRETEHYNHVLKTISGLPTEEFKPLEQCGIHDMKERLKLRGVPTKDCLEKEELVKKLHDFRGGPTESCCICCEDYVDGDVLRILSKCKHDFHLECLDKWALTLANTTREPSCPLCNQTLE
ncbi:hypothetical protein THRCLA_22135 [Thraustotheca clavata]|uniref:RING-type domain-containing protein n=1 Tax=Thraustotheca clavata TaxID=74557 RepID=A0A1V9ZBV0_9STRA|nr:hypothetical protein THRCLA_22135 [Thraustotheca clavata]